MTTQEARSDAFVDPFHAVRFRPKDSTFLAEDGDHPDLRFPDYRQVKLTALESMATEDNCG